MNIGFQLSEKLTMIMTNNVKYFLLGCPRCPRRFRRRHRRSPPPRGRRGGADAQTTEDDGRGGGRVVPSRRLVLGRRGSCFGRRGSSAAPRSGCLRFCHPSLPFNFNSVRSNNLVKIFNHYAMTADQENTPFPTTNDLTNFE